MKVLLTLLLLFGNLAVSGQTVSFSNFEVIHSDSTRLTFEEVPLKSAQLSKKKDNTLLGYHYIYTLNQEYNMKHYFFPARGSLDQDTLELLDNKIPLTDFFISNGFISYNPIVIILLEKVYKFEYQNKHYLLLLLWTYQGNISDRFHYPVLVNLENPDEIYFVGRKGKSDYEGASLRFYPDYLGDFNQDGNLDCVLWNYADKKLEFYTLLEGEFVLDNSKYLYLERDIIYNTMGIGTYIHGINVQKSNWFYEIEGKEGLDYPNTLPYPEPLHLYLNFD